MKKLLATGLVAFSFTGISHAQDNDTQADFTSCDGAMATVVSVDDMGFSEPKFVAVHFDQGDDRYLTEFEKSAYSPQKNDRMCLSPQGDEQ